MFVVVSLLLLRSGFEKLRVLTAHGKMRFDHWVANSTNGGRANNPKTRLTWQEQQSKVCLQFVFFSLPGLQHKTISFFSETISKRRSIEILLHFFNLISLKLDPNSNQMSYPWYMHRSVRSAAKQLHSLDHLGKHWSDRTGWRRIERREIKSSEKRSIRIERIQKPSPHIKRSKLSTQHSFKPPKPGRIKIQFTLRPDCFDIQPTCGLASEQTTKRPVRRVHVCDHSMDEL